MRRSRYLSLVLHGLAALLLTASAGAGPQIPEKLLGIWTPDGTTLTGDVVTSGQGIYLDVDGVGALVVRNGAIKTLSRIVVTGYSASAGRLEVDVTDGGQVVRHLSLSYDARQNVLVSPDDSAALFHRRKLEMSPDVRAALGLETRPLSVPSVLVPRAPAAPGAASSPQ